MSALLCVVYICPVFSVFIVSSRFLILGRYFFLERWQTWPVRRAASCYVCISSLCDILKIRQMPSVLQGAHRNISSTERRHTLGWIVLKQSIHPAATVWLPFRLFHLTVDLHARLIGWFTAGQFDGIWGHRAGVGVDSVLLVKVAPPPSGSPSLRSCWQKRCFSTTFSVRPSRRV